MTAYLLRSNVRDYQSLVPPEDPSILNIVQSFDGRRIGPSWHPLEVEIDEESVSLPKSDFSSIGFHHIPVFSAQAKEALKDLLKNNGEILPLQCEDADYFAFNVTSIVDALDLLQSDIKYFPTGRIMTVKRYVLFNDKTEVPIFKLPQTLLMDVFVNESFVHAVQEASLTGFLFEPVSEVRVNGFERPDSATIG